MGKVKQQVYTYTDDPENNEYCGKCKDFHNPLLSCKDLTLAEWKIELEPIIERVNKKFKEKQYWCELERFKRMWE